MQADESTATATSVSSLRCAALYACLAASCCCCLFLFLAVSLHTHLPAPLYVASCQDGACQPRCGNVQAIMMVDLSFAAIAHHEELRKMPGLQGGTSASDDLKAVLLHGAQYLLNCHDPVANTVVAVVATGEGLNANPNAEWIAPEQVPAPATSAHTVLLHEWQHHIPIAALAACADIALFTRTCVCCPVAALMQSTLCVDIEHPPVES